MKQWGRYFSSMIPMNQSKRQGTYLHSFPEPNGGVHRPRSLAEVGFRSFERAAGAAGSWKSELSPIHFCPLLSCDGAVSDFTPLICLDSWCQEQEGASTIFVSLSPLQPSPIQHLRINLPLAYQMQWLIAELMLKL